MADSDWVHVHIDLERDGLLESIDLACQGADVDRDYRPFPRSIGTGGVELVMLSHDIAYLHGRARVEGNSETSASIEVPERFFQFVFRLSPEQTLVQLDGVAPTVPFRSGDSLILCPSMNGTQVFSPGERADEISFLVDAALVETIFEEHGAAIPRSLTTVLGCSENGIPAPPGVTTGEMRRTIDDILHSDLEGSLLAIYREAKVHELLALRLAQDPVLEVTSRKPVLLQRDLHLLDQAHEVLEARFIDPPSISELASIVGLNRTKLKAGFKEVFGTTIFSFVRARRLECALKLLQDGSCNVGEAATRVGYRSFSAFTRAFHSEFGFSARTVRGGTRDEEDG